MEDMKKEVAGKSRAEEMKEKYGKVYRVGATIEVDDETEKNVEFFFKRPSTASYDRYVRPSLCPVETREAGGESVLHLLQGHRTHFRRHEEGRLPASG